MSYRIGRLIDHLHIRVADLDTSRRFYAAVLDSLGHGEVLVDGGDHFHADELYVDATPGRIGHVHLAFQARTRAHVDAFHAAALAAGGTDNGAPGLRHYHPRYYAAFVRDPDGNNIEAVCDAPVIRSAAAIEITRTD